ncbi:MAG: 2OG-Fe(II) oxygenase [Gomphosphaeria aponina SAG 52.96 = DSM 107014]|uniref:2OG-Fe(II) oxygenase n=1 Tax=Gomphosphaeria aponina SAG 52.96 = DSM 107014 TaxID=1521640 RepID=A0A941GLM9_9CHRO|nr:2OG-Fe(II) oxygenase [Gomphosphaeria aponina SAG 52.96 = DSM 107014]
MSYFQQYPQSFSPTYLSKLKGHILNCKYFTVNNLNRDFVNTKGFSLVFRRSHLSLVEQDFPYFKPYLNRAMLPECNAFYLNPLLLQTGSQVDPHIDRSLRSYCKTIAPPLMVSVLYVEVPLDLVGGELILRSPKRQVGKISPQVNTLLFFQGDLTHSVNPVTRGNSRLSLVCEQYCLDDLQLEEIPEFQVESRINQSKNKVKKLTNSHGKINGL